ncbi:hypothetical protein VTP01DRAFT_1010 [Rhizomucor pusillus]|uniref:40S ribosomal protein eS10 n=1 Tax=Rhizomucor pusillus TaxID=4840 RepID=UPI003742687E
MLNLSFHASSAYIRTLFDLTFSTNHKIPLAGIIVTPNDMEEDLSSRRFNCTQGTPVMSTGQLIMLIQKQNRKAIYEALFKDGALVAAKDFNAPKHPDIDVPNLEVIKAMQSLTSKGFVKTQFSWQYYYYTLTNEGIDYLREYLHLPQEIVPATLKKTARPAAPRRAFGGEGREGARGPRGDRDDYRRKEGAGGDFEPKFRGGFGRGRRE